jgi:hypothetical protein
MAMRNVMSSWAQGVGGFCAFSLVTTLEVESWASLWIFVDAGGNDGRFCKGG